MNTVFVDTSVLVAAEDTGQGALHAAVLQWLDLLWRTRSGRTGSQSLCEFYEQVTTAAQPLPQGDARAAIRKLAASRFRRCAAVSAAQPWARHGPQQLDALAKRQAITAAARARSRLRGESAD